MLLEEFEADPAVIEPTGHSIRGGGEVCDTLILSFNGEVIERITKLKDVWWDKCQEDCMVFFGVAMAIARKLESRSC